eukprot:TRINITY_DN3314_c0_g1_i2.p1 TRINITY_DN3314_c0_g1~~TRINITY_DN3314_c0_g1_i2.p1  ORF type:complete len:503 (-),score=95.90 TRINITY_DN3314_c0_g1_i2:118-1626(-)
MGDFNHESETVIELNEMSSSNNTDNDGENSLHNSTHEPTTLDREEKQEQPKTEKQLQEERRRERREKRKQEQERKSMARRKALQDTGSRAFAIITIVLGLIFALIGAALHFGKILFNISFLSNAFRVTVPSIPKLSVIKDTIHQGLNHVPQLQQLYYFWEPIMNFVSKALVSVDMAYLWRAETRCGGYLRFLELFAMLYFFIFVIILLASPVLYFFLITARKLKRVFKLKVLQMVFVKLFDVYRTLVFIGLQLLGLVGLQVIRNSIKKSGVLTCGPLDQKFLSAGYIISWAILVVLIIPALGTFVGGMAVFRFAKKTRSDNKLGALILVAVAAAKQIVFLTLGVWDRDALESFKVVEVAQKYDDDPTDDDNQQENVIEIIAKTRSLVWILFPGTVVLTKVCELMNDSLVFIYRDIQLETPFKLRLFKWVFNVVEAVATIVITFKPSPALVYILTIIVALDFLAQVIVVVLKAKQNYRRKTQSATPNTLYVDSKNPETTETAS